MALKREQKGAQRFTKLEGVSENAVMLEKEQEWENECLSMVHVNRAI